MIVAGGLALNEYALNENQHWIGYTLSGIGISSTIIMSLEMVGVKILDKDYALPKKIKINGNGKSHSYIDAFDVKSLLRNTKINIKANNTKQWEVITDNKGIFEIDLVPFNNTSPRAKVISFQFNIANKNLGKTTVPVSFFSELNEYYSSIKPPTLQIDCMFDDSKSWNPNKIIDGGENSLIIVKTENIGEGKALDVNLILKSNYMGIIYDQIINIGTILPQNKIKKKFKIFAPITISDGIANFFIQAEEKRGNHSRPVNMKISTHHLDKAKFKIETVDINDANIGQAIGNGNGIPENGETVEIIAYIKNTGVGKAIKSKLKLKLFSSGLKSVSLIDNLGTILPGKTQKGKVVFMIPQTFSGKKIDYQLTVSDELGTHKFNKDYSVPTAINVPVLSYDFKTPDIINNGKSYPIRIKPKNIGRLDAKNVQLKVTTTSGIKLSNNNLSLGTIKKSDSMTAQKIYINIPRSFQEPDIKLQIEMKQANFEGLTKTEILKLDKISPQLNLSDKVLDFNQSGTIEQGETIDLEFTIRNQGKLEAQNVQFTLNTKAPMLQSYFPKTNRIGTIPPGGSESRKFTFTIPSGMPTGKLIFSAHISQADFPSMQKSINYRIHEQTTITQIVKGKNIPVANPMVGITGTRGNTEPEIFFDNYQQIVTQPNFTPDILIFDDQSLNQIKITLDGKVQSALNPGNRRYTFRENIFLNSGENRLKIFAVDNNNVPSEKEFKIIYKPGSTNFAGMRLDPYNIEIEKVPQRDVDGSDILAIIIGIENYKDALPVVTFAKRDAFVVSEYMKDFFGVPEENIKVLLDSDATYSGLKKNFGSKLKKRLRNNPEITKIFIYYAGHGTPVKLDDDWKNYLIPWDGDAQALEDTGYLLSDLYKQLSRFSSHKIYLVFDACFSGKSGRNKSIEYITKGTRAVQISMEKPMASSNTFVYSAATKDQVSYPFELMKHGLFTYYFLKGLKDGKLSNNQLQEYLSSEVPKAADKYIGGTQNPDFQGSFNNNEEFLK